MRYDGNRLAELARLFYQRFAEERCIQIASSLTFTTLLALVPIVTVALIVISAFPVFQSFAAQAQDFVVKNLLPESVAALTGYAERFSANARRLTTVGIVFLGVTALMMMLTIDSAFNNIWRVSIRRSLLQRLMVYWVVLTVGPLFVGASLSFTSYLITLSLGLIDNPPGVALTLLKLVSWVVTSAAFALLYYAVPNRRILKRDALLGGAVAGVCFEVMKQGFGYSVTYFPTHQLVYGAFAAVPVFLIWIYLSWLIVIGGAVLVAMLPEWREHAGRARPAPGGDFFDAVRVLAALWEAHRNGVVVTLRALRPQVVAEVDRLERILETMSAAGWVTRAGPEGCVLSRDAATISVGEVYRLFVFDPEPRLSPRRADSELESLLHELAPPAAGVLQLPLAQLFERAHAQSEPASATTRAA